MFSPPTIRDDANGLPILVKHASGDRRQLLRREAELLEAASHLSVVQMRGLLELEDRSELMLSYVQGASLAEHPPLAFDVLLDVALQLAGTLADLLAVGIAHKAIVAEHVLIDKNGQVVLCGFGNAVATAAAQNVERAGAQDAPRAGAQAAVQDAPRADAQDAAQVGVPIREVFGEHNATSGEHHGAFGEHSGALREHRGLPEDYNSQTVRALAELIEAELIRSEDAGLTSQHRRQANELQTIIRFATQDRAGSHNANHHNANHHNAGGRVDLRAWAAHIEEIAFATDTAVNASAGRRRSFNVRSWFSRSGTGRSWTGRSRTGRSWFRHSATGGVKRWLLAGLAVVVGFAVWQIQFSSNPGTDPTGSNSGDSAEGPGIGGTGIGGTDVEGTGFAGAGANGTDFNGIGAAGGSAGASGSAGAGSGADASQRPLGVLVTGITPERCFEIANGNGVAGAASGAAGGANSANGSAAGAGGASASALSTIIAASELDTNGDGCPEQVQVGTVNDAGAPAAQPAIAINNRLWLIGNPGDHVAVGDWNCDGIVTPAVVRPTSGEAFFFAVWPYKSPGNESPGVQPAFRSSVPIGATGVSASPATAESNSPGNQSPGNQRCHALYVSFTEQTLILKPNRSWSSVALSPHT